MGVAELDAVVVVVAVVVIVAVVLVAAGVVMVAVAGPSSVVSRHRTVPSTTPNTTLTRTA